MRFPSLCTQHQLPDADIHLASSEHFESFGGRGDGWLTELNSTGVVELIGKCLYIGLQHQSRNFGHINEVQDHVVANRQLDFLTETYHSLTGILGSQM